MRRGGLLALMTVIMCSACQRTSQPGATADTTSAALAPAPGDSAQRKEAAPAESVRIARPPSAEMPREAQGPISVLPRGDTAAGQPATVQEIVVSEELVGKRVRVTGRCLGYSTPVTVGSPPRTRSDWQLEADGFAVYVTGPLPTGCSVTEGSKEVTTILALVVEDTLPARGERPATPRRYLVRLRE